jgi:tellurite resistance protein TehA-like permease
VAALAAHGATIVLFGRAVLRTARGGGGSGGSGGSGGGNGSGGGSRTRAVLQAMSAVWVIPPVGIAVGTLSGGAFTARLTAGSAAAGFVDALRRAALWEALAALLLMTPLLWAKVLYAWPAPCVRRAAAPLPPSRLATTAVLVAPYALCLAALYSYYGGGGGAAGEAEAAAAAAEPAWVRGLGDVLFALALSALLVLLWHTPRIWREGWQPSWACLTFPLDILSQGGLHWRRAHAHAADPAADGWCWALLLLATTVVLLVWCGALRHVWRRVGLIERHVMRTRYQADDGGSVTSNV